ncbi:hypothetical protein ACFFRR_002168 [Megaselia abdita]
MFFKTSVVLLVAVFGVAFAASFDNVNSRVRRQGFGAPQGFSTDKAEALLKKTLVKISEESKADIKLIKVLSATSQTVAGFIYNMKANLEVNGKVMENCEVKILEKLEGEKKGETEIKCPSGHNEKYFHNIAKRALTVKGGAKDSTPEEATVIINKYLKGSEYSLVKVESATVQSVQGFIHRIKADMKSGKDVVETCDIVITEDPLNDTDKAVEFKLNCNKSGEKILFFKFVK